MTSEASTLYKLIILYMLEKADYRIHAKGHVPPRRQGRRKNRERRVLHLERPAG